MPTPQQRRYQAIRRLLQARGISRPQASQIILEGHKNETTPLQWRKLLSISRRNPSCLLLAPRLLSFRLRVDPDALETPELQGRIARLKKQVDDRRFEKPKGQKCPACLEPTLMVEFQRRSTGMGHKCEDVRIAKCSCGYRD